MEKFGEIDYPYCCSYFWFSNQGAQLFVLIFIQRVVCVCTVAH